MLLVPPFARAAPLREDGLGLPFLPHPVTFTRNPSGRNQQHRTCSHTPSRLERSILAPAFYAALQDEDVGAASDTQGECGLRR